MKKKGLFLTIKAIFAVFLVIFVFLMFMSVLRSRTATLESRQHFDYYYLTNNFMLALLSEPECIAVGAYGNQSWQVPVQALLSSVKLDAYTRKNIDLDCIENYDFLYSLEVRDLSNDKTWNIGLQNMDLRFIDRPINTPLFVSIMYNNDPSEIRTGKAILKSYIGDIPRFYGEIKKACNLATDRNYRINIDKKISYTNAVNTFCIEDYCFYPYFTCRVNDFELPKGEHLIKLKYQKGNLRILI